MSLVLWWWSVHVSNTHHVTVKIVSHTPLWMVFCISPLSQRSSYGLNVEHFKVECLRWACKAGGAGVVSLAAPGLHDHIALDQASNSNVNVFGCKQKQISCLLMLNKTLYNRDVLRKRHFNKVFAPTVVVDICLAMLIKSMFAFDWRFWKGWFTLRTSQLAALFSSSWNCSGMSCSNGKALMYCRWFPGKGWHGTVWDRPRSILNVWRYLFFWIQGREMWHIWIFGHFSPQFLAKMYLYSSCMGTVACCARARLRCHFCPPSEPLRNKMKVKISWTSYSWIRDQRRQVNNVVGRNRKKKTAAREGSRPRAWIFFWFFFWQTSGQYWRFSDLWW